MRGAKRESFEVAVIENVIIRGNSREGCSSILYMPKLNCNLLGRGIQTQLGIGVVPWEGNGGGSYEVERDRCGGN